MSETVNIDQDNQQGDDQHHISKKAKRNLEAMEEVGGNDPEKEQQEVDKEKKTPTMSKQYNSDDADISMISSDNILFKVHSYRLMTASTIFRDMLSMPDSAARRGPLYLTDAKLELSEVVEHLLDIIYTFENKYVGSRLFAVIDLAEKWDFVQVLHTIRRDLSNLEARADTFLRFQLSIKLKEPRAIANCLRRRHSVAWRDIRGDPQANRFVSYQTTRSVYDEAAPKLLDEDFIGGNRVFDVATWSYGSFLLTPPTVLWTLLRATHVGTTSPAQIDHDKVADEFERLLTLAYKPKKADGDKDKSNAGA